MLKRRTFDMLRIRRLVRDRSWLCSHSSRLSGRQGPSKIKSIDQGASICLSSRYRRGNNNRAFDHEAQYSKKADGMGLTSYFSTAAVAPFQNEWITLIRRQQAGERLAITRELITSIHMVLKNVMKTQRGSRQAHENQKSCEDWVSQASACLVLSNLALEAEDATETKKLWDLLEVDVLWSLLTETSHEVLQKTLLTCLANLAGNSSGRLALWEQSPRLLETLNLFTSPKPEIPLDQSIQAAAAFALGNVLVDHKRAQDRLLEQSPQIISSNLLLLLCPITFHEETREYASWALLNALREHKPNQDVFGQAGGFAWIIDNLRHIDSETNVALQQNLLLVMYHGIQDHAINQAICIRKDGIEAIEPFLQSTLTDTRVFARDICHELESFLEQHPSDPLLASTHV